jgi:lysozyme
MSLPGAGFLIGHGHHEDAARAEAISAEEAADLLRADLAPIERAVAAALFAPVSGNQFDALVSFAFSIGIEEFLASETRRLLNAGEPLAAAQAMGAWRCSGQTQIDALVRRRAAEQAMFLALDPPVAAPSVLLRPTRSSEKGALQRAEAPRSGLGPEVQDRLKKIFASRPETAGALLAPPPEPPDEAPSTPPPRPSPVSRRGGVDQIALAALAAFGASLLLVGVAGFAAGGSYASLSFLLFGAPGALASLIALYNLARLGS